MMPLGFYFIHVFVLLQKVIVCALCAEEGHICRNCPHSFCHNCETPGHESKFCPAPRRRWNRACFRCDMPGHDEKVSTAKPGFEDYLWKSRRMV